ncbi:T9SS type A sorting domain-containing protein [Mariniflexile jejuense]|uniref:T9SS type A sorting domain-containing protein n=1 Tax=Mariniflexile jejuense TaxID=1173582 RepID=A0ABW3JGX7_9FLAO
MGHRLHHTNIDIAKTVVLVLAFFINETLCSQNIPSFSGAEGFGAVTVGGRGGDVYHVTNLNDSGPGSFRAGCQASGARTIVFDVSGIINLTSEVQIINPYITIAGQTAPGDGVIIAGATVNMTGRVNDILIRYMRFRRSYDKSGPAPIPNQPSAGQCLVGMSVSKNIMIDHVSSSWGTDENMSMYRCQLDGGKLIPTKNITVQWSIISEALNPENHGFANTWGGQGANHHHNLMACNVGRNPSISFSHFMDFRNNVIFNWRDRSMDGAGKEAHMNVINNYYKPGPATGYNYNWSLPAPELKVRIVLPEVRTWDTALALGLNNKSRYSGPGVIGWWYIDGNVMEGHPTITNNNWEGTSLVDGKYYKGVQWSSIVEPYPGIGPAIGEAHPEWQGQYMSDHLEWVKVNQPHTRVSFPEDPLDPYDGSGGTTFVIPDLPIIATQTASDSYTSVLAGAGATLPIRDAVDVRIVNVTATGNATAGSRSNGIINHPDEVGGYPVIAQIQRPLNWDTDLDGMPDAWELERNLNPNDATDRNHDYDNDGYTNLEEYLNDIGAFKAVQDIVWDGDVDSRYAKIQNWDLAFQPSRFDTAIINNATVLVDAIDQHAGTLKLNNCATLNIITGWLKVANTLETDACSQTNVDTNGTLNVDVVTNNGTFVLNGDAVLTVGNTFVNYGTLDVSDWNGSGINNFVNYGTVIGDINKTLSSNSFDKQNGNNGILYPIPVQDVLNISLDKNTQGKVNVTVFDLTGKAVKAFEVLNNNFNINVSNLTQGMYLVKIVTNNVSLVKRIIKN